MKARLGALRARWRRGPAATMTSEALLQVQTLLTS